MATAREKAALTQRLHKARKKSIRKKVKNGEEGAQTESSNLWRSRLLGFITFFTVIFLRYLI